MTERKYLPTFAELVDRLTICQLKAIHIPDKREQYMQEMADIEHDIDLLLGEQYNAMGRHMCASEVRAIAAVMLTNYAIWVNESMTREGDQEFDLQITLTRLRFTHSINGQRNTAKNKLAKWSGERQDAKIDCFAADLVKDFGNWSIWDA